MNSALRLNPEQKAASLNLLAVTAAGPALIYLGLRHAPTIGQKVGFAALGALLITTNFSALKTTFTKDEGAM